MKIKISIIWIFLTMGCQIVSNESSSGACSVNLINGPFYNATDSMELEYTVNKTDASPIYVVRQPPDTVISKYIVTSKPINKDSLEVDYKIVESITQCNSDPCNAFNIDNTIKLDTVESRSLFVINGNQFHQVVGSQPIPYLDSAFIDSSGISKVSPNTLGAISIKSEYTNGQCLESYVHIFRFQDYGTFHYKELGTYEKNVGLIKYESDVQSYVGAGGGSYEVILTSKRKI